MLLVVDRDHRDACRALAERYGQPRMPEPYVCGLDAIDREHAVVVAQHHALLDALRSPDRRALARELGAYAGLVEAHYRSEELLQRELGFPEVVEHARVHARFLAGLQRMVEELRLGGPTPALAEWVKQGSPHWLGIHIQNDRAIARWYREQGEPLGDPELIWRAGVPAFSASSDRSARKG